MGEYESISLSGRSLVQRILSPGIEMYVVLGALIFAADLFSPRNLITSLLYIPLVWFACRLPSRQSVFIVATVGSGLTLLGAVYSATESGMIVDFLNRLFVIILMWALPLALRWQEEAPDPVLGRTLMKGAHRPSIGDEEGSPVMNEAKSKEQTLTALNQTLMDQNQELEMLVNVVSHDLRSPLVNIQGFSKELAGACERLGGKLEHVSGREDDKGEISEIVEQEIPESLQYIKAAAGKMDAVLSGILRFTRLGRMSLKIEALDVNAMVSAITTAMEFQMKEKGVALQIHDLPESVGDETLVSQVFFNLLENAHKYLDPARPGMITISGYVENRQVVYAVKDNGIGILPEHQGKIFDMFHRLNPKWESGEGLGLTIVKRIVDRHQGDVWLDSQHGVGTTFFVSFPQTVEGQKEDHH